MVPLVEKNCRSVSAIRDHTDIDRQSFLYFGFDSNSSVQSSPFTKCCAPFFWGDNCWFRGQLS